MGETPTKQTLLTDIFKYTADDMPYLTIITARNKKRGGRKSSLMYSLVRPFFCPLYNRRWLKYMSNMIDEIREMGWENAQMPKNIESPVFTVAPARFVSYDSTYRPIASNVIDFNSLRVPDTEEDGPRQPPYSVICVQDASVFVEARNSTNGNAPTEDFLDYLIYQRKPEHRLIMDVQNVISMDKRYRELADCIIEIQSTKFEKGNFDKRAVLTFDLLVFSNYESFERYKTSGDTAEGIRCTHTHVGELYGVKRNGKTIKQCMEHRAGLERFTTGQNWNYEVPKAEPFKNDRVSMELRNAQIMASKNKKKKEAS